MKEAEAPAPIRLALDVRDDVLGARLAALLGQIGGLELVADSDRADAVLSEPAGRPARANGEDLALSPRELEVLGLLADGASNKAIARSLGISIHTAKFHIGSLLDKLDAGGRTDAVAQAARLGVIKL